MNPHPSGRLAPQELVVRRPGPAGFLESIAGRLVLLGLLLGAELLLTTFWLDAESLRSSRGLASLVFRFGPWTARALVAAAAFFLAFSYLDRDKRVPDFVRSGAAAPVSLVLLASHTLAALAFVWFSTLLFRSGGGQTDGLTAVWSGSAVLAAAAACVALVSPPDWRGLLRASGNKWRWGLAAGIVTAALGSLWWSLWAPAAGLTFRLVRFLLTLFTGNIISNPATREIGTPRFDVQIDPACSGLEGVGLVLVFSSVWLWLHRREFRFPRAFLILPAGAVLIWLLNSVRITALILIGHAGAPGIAAGGFHSQAGWLTFIALSIALAQASTRISWLLGRQTREETPQPGIQTNATAAYLMPFLVILAASMVSRAVSSGFEWFYPLRFFAAAITIWVYRSYYSRLDWRFDWVAPCAGAAVFALWLGFERVVPSGGASLIGEALKPVPAWLAGLWIVFRALAHIVTVPIAEELAFRGFLIRRVMTEDFESLDPRRYTWISLAVSSLAFGVMHGDRWLVGTLAGALYAAAFLRRGRIGDAIVAHATTNALLAAYVLTTGSWNLW